MRIVIPGGSGQVGQVLAYYFHAQGHSVTVLSRNPRPAPWQVVPWNARTAGAWEESLRQADVCINLTGRSVNCRYHAANRREIYDSRIDSTRLLNSVISSMDHPPRLWLNASTATIYRHVPAGTADDRPMDEASGELGGNEPDAPDTWNFSIKVAKDWEQAFFETPTPHTRKIALRSSITFNPDKGSAFAVLSNLVRCGLGGTEGSGSQYVSWIHEADFIRAVEWLIAKETMDGAVNICSPNPLPNREFLRGLRQAWGQRIGLPAPAWIIEMGTFLLQTESELVLKSRRVIPGRLLNDGFQFQFTQWTAAAHDLVRRWKSKHT